jgi:thiamine biosynthesis lipoprotein
MQRQSRRAFLDFMTRRTPPADNCWLHINRTAMACRFEVTLPMSEQGGVAAATEALNEIDRIEDKLTVFRETSEISRINRCAAAEPVRVDPTLFKLLVLCKELYRATEGAFDITSGPLTRCWGFLRREGRLPSNSQIATALASVGSDKLLLDPASRSIRFAEAGVEINLGSIGKGYALDCVSTSVGRKIRTALLNAGSSSIRALGDGEPEHGGWVVGLRDPRAKTRRMGVLRLRDCAMSTSGTEEQFFEHDGKRYGHIIDPRTGWPASSVSSVIVVADSAAVSDALATAFFVGGRELAERYCAVDTEVLVILLESDSDTPIVIGSNKGCEGPTDL